MDMDCCVSCGLIINELVSNALKYAFKDAINGKISICLIKTSLNQVVLFVMDDGCGIPSNLKIEESESLGLKIVNLLTIGQLKGKLTIDSKTGTRFDIQFPLIQKE
jgi:two-component sensor histidine kinase